MKWFAKTHGRYLCVRGGINCDLKSWFPSQISFNILNLQANAKPQHQITKLKFLEYTRNNALPTLYCIMSAQDSSPVSNSTRLDKTSNGAPEFEKEALSIENKYKLLHAGSNRKEDRECRLRSLAGGRWGCWCGRVVDSNGKVSTRKITKKEYKERLDKWLGYGDAEESEEEGEQAARRRRSRRSRTTS
jgi:hypothetical protein